MFFVCNWNFIWNLISAKQLLTDQNNDEENKQPMEELATTNELQTSNLPEREMVSLDKYRLEMEQRVRQQNEKN